MRSPLLSLLVLTTSTLAACSSTPASLPGGLSDPTPQERTLPDGSDLPIDGIPRALAVRFNDGDVMFGTPFREGDGLGPLYVRQSCAACHESGGRGPGLVQKMSIVGDDGAPSPDQSKLPFGHTVRLLMAAGATTPISAPTDLGGHLHVSIRVGPPVLARGYLEAIADDEIERGAAEQAARTDGIHGRVNRVTYLSEANTETKFHAHAKGQDNLIGRFGLKARIASVDEFVADAFQGDMGVTSPMRPVELANPDGLTDDRKPGVDLDLATVNLVADYVRLIAIPLRKAPPAAGQQAFAAAKCSVCHTPSLKTRADYPIAKLAGIDAPVYTDLLLHDMGPALADGLEEGSARARDWRTAPLVGLRFQRTFLHDGRALTVEDAVRQHGGTGSEADESTRLFLALPASDRAALLEYVNGL